MKKLIAVLLLLLPFFYLPAADEPIRRLHPKERSADAIYVRPPGRPLMDIVKENTEYEPRTADWVKVTARLLSDMNQSDASINCAHANNIYLIESKGDAENTKEALRNLGWEPYGTLSEMMKKRQLAEFLALGCDSRATVRGEEKGCTRRACMEECSAKKAIKDSKKLRFVYLAMKELKSKHLQKGEMCKNQNKNSQKRIMLFQLVCSALQQKPYTYIQYLKSGVFGLSSEDDSSDEVIQNIAGQLGVTFFGPVTTDNIAEIFAATEREDTSDDRDSSRSQDLINLHSSE